MTTLACQTTAQTLESTRDLFIGETHTEYGFQQQCLADTHTSIPTGTKAYISVCPGGWRLGVPASLP